jgi:hypothetical protein
MHSNTKSVGEVSEAIVLAELAKKGYAVSTPFGNNQRYDFIVDDGKTLARVQVKTGNLVNGCISFATCSKNGFTGERKDYSGQIEFFLVYSPDTKEVYKVPVSVVSKTQMLLRTEPAKKNFGTIRWAKDFVLNVNS